MIRCAFCDSAMMALEINGTNAHVCPLCGAVFARRHGNTYSLIADLKGAQGVKELLHSNKQHTSAMIRAGKLPRQMPAYKAASDLSGYRAKIQAKAGLSDATLDYLQAYKYGADLLRKLAAAMG